MSRTPAALALLLAAALARLPAEAAASKPYGASVVALVVTSQQWNEDRPWEKKAPESRRVNAVVVDGPCLLTTAQMVGNASLIQAEKFGRSVRVTARVLHADREADLALVAIDDPEFFSDLAPARLAEASVLDGTLRTVRWRNQQLEVSASRVQRMEVQESYFGRLEHPFLLVQTDLSGGGWAEPVFADHSLVGVTVSQDEQSARVIPIEIVSAYLARARSGGEYLGFPSLGADWQVHEDPALARFLGQQGEPSGILIRRVPRGTTADGVLEPRDVLLSIDGHPIDQSGFYLDPRFGSVRFPAILTVGHRVGDAVPARVLRGGEVKEVRLTLREYRLEMDLVPQRRGDDPPPYLVAGGLLLRELDGDYLRSWGRDWSKKAPLRLMSRYRLEASAQNPDRRRIVILQYVLPSAYDVGYQGLSDVIVERINGRPVDSIAAAAEAFRHPQDGFHTVELKPNGQASLVVLDAEGFERATAEILEEYGIPEASRPATRVPPELGEE